MGGGTVAARVATAAPVYFSPLELIGRKFIDGGAGYNNLNPSVEVFHEVMDLWRISPSTHACSVGIGTGSSGSRPEHQFLYIQSGPLSSQSLFSILAPLLGKLNLPTLLSFGKWEKYCGTTCKSIAKSTSVRRSVPRPSGLLHFSLSNR